MAPFVKTLIFKINKVVELILHYLVENFDEKAFYLHHINPMNAINSSIWWLEAYMEGSYSHMFVLLLVEAIK